MEIEIRKVTCREELDDFVLLPRMMCRDVPQYVPDLDREITGLLNRKDNPGLEFSDIQFFVAYHSDVPIGRIAGLINRRANERWQRRVVRFGLIEFVDDMNVSRALLEAVGQWGWELGMDTLEGPMGITDFDKEGMLIEDFHLAGTMNTIWNPDYYPRHMEALGFQKAVDWVQIRIQIPKETPPRYRRAAQYVKEELGLRVVKLSHSDFGKRGYGQRIFQLLNRAYEPLFGFSAMSEQQVDCFVDKYLKLVDLKLVPVVMNEKDEVVGVAVTMGSMTEALQKANGRLWPFGWYHLLKALKWKHADSAEMLLIAVRPDYQGMGVNALFFDDLIPVYNQYRFKWAETGPQLEDNMPELSQWKPLHPEFVKRRRCYSKAIPT